MHNEFMDIMDSKDIERKFAILDEEYAIYRGARKQLIGPEAQAMPATAG